MAVRESDFASGPARAARAQESVVDGVPHGVFTPAANCISMIQIMASRPALCAMADSARALYTSSGGGWRRSVTAADSVPNICGNAPRDSVGTAVRPAGSGYFACSIHSAWIRDQWAVSKDFPP